MLKSGLVLSISAQAKLRTMTRLQVELFDMSLMAAFLQPERHMTIVYTKRFTRKNGIFDGFIAEITDALIAFIICQDGEIGLLEFVMLNAETHSHYIAT